MISIVIPVLNEADNIGDLLNHISQNTSASNISEIIIVDGGSTDGTQNIVLDSNSSKAIETILISSKKGRAKQMNFGVKHTKGNILYFLHADSFPPINFDQLIINEVEKGNNAGCFRMEFDSKHWWLKTASWFTQFSWRICRGGDQSQFITKTLFNEIGGYDESYIIYEDNILINELYARNEFVVINKKIRTSARLYNKHGIWKVQYHFWSIYLKKWFGSSADEMFAYYQKHLC